MNPSGPSKRTRTVLFAVAAAVLAIVFGASAAVRMAVRLQRASEPALETLPVLGTLPPFSLVDQDGRAFGASELKGKVWVANFIFTRCPTVCPAFTRKMAQVQSQTGDLQGKLTLVSFSVDPGYDTPEVLRAYAEKHRARPEMWRFLTGNPESIRATVVDGLKTSMGREGPADDLNSIFHGTHFVLVDQDLRIRGYYRSEDDDKVAELVRDARTLADQG